MRPPVALEREWARESAWLASLPALADELASRWNLTLEEPFDTPHSLVVPAGDVVLKVNAPSHFEADHEPDALALWGGRGAVRLLERDDELRAFAIERCRPGTQLGEDGVDVVAALLPELWEPPAEPHPFRLLADEADRWLHEVRARYDGSFERALLDAALDVFASADRAARALVNQDLHGANVLRAAREPWLVVDPKPVVGEREANGVGPLRNAAAKGGARAVTRWLDAFADVGLDRERTRAWGAAHALAWGFGDDGWSPGSVDVARTITLAR